MFDIAAVEAFLSQETTLARRDRVAQMNEQEWEGPEVVPVDQIRQRLSGFEALVEEDGVFNLPLHERNSAELTGEFVQFTRSGLMPCFVYYETIRL